MNDPVFGQMGQPSQDVLDDRFCILLLDLDSALSYNESYFEEIVQLRALEVFQYDINRIFSLVNSLQAHYVTVIHSSH